MGVTLDGLEPITLEDAMASVGWEPSGEGAEPVPLTADEAREVVRDGED